MDFKTFGSTGISVPEIGQGTWDIPESGARCDAAQSAIRRGIELQMTHLDTAEMYGSGRVEEIVGEALAGIERSRLFIASKVLPGNASYEGTIAACERSLERLRIAYFDAYLLHWPGSYPLEDTMRALEYLVESGKARCIGVSNFDVDDVKQAQACLRRVPLACNQVLYNLGERGIESRLIPYCSSQNIAVVAYTPFGRGGTGQGARAGGDVLAKIARKHAKTPRQVTLRFLTREKHVFTIPKASTQPHVEENAGASGWSLDPDDVADIDAAFPRRDGPLATL
ncbi:MAG: aldo/keto reductase [Candidatus Eremiobacteraeota bacterium]|nr:aldo/keto reductase [Candidatus Eremiobacteraeota bacterium]